MKKIKLIIFDLDGVLVDAKEMHYTTLNLALSEIDDKYVITKDEHLSTYDGLKTNQKLELLTNRKGLPKSEHKKIWYRKQELTANEIANITHNKKLINLFDNLKKRGYKLACCSNSIKATVNMMLTNIGIIKYFDIILSNEDVKNSKPHPEMYWDAMKQLCVLPNETLIVEDSPNGLYAAYSSNANVLRVNNVDDLTLSKVENEINLLSNTINVPKWVDKNLNILIPMAGLGSRFKNVGYTLPKPLIDVNGKPMIQVVVENLNIDANYIFVVQKEHNEKYNLNVMLNLIVPNCKVVEVDGLTEGAACTTLLAKHFIDNEKPLLIANSDQFLIWNSNEFMYKMNESNADGGIITFESSHNKWSYAKIDECGFVSEVAEKKPISTHATVGLYYWRKGSDYIKYTEQMIDKDIRVNNEFYVCPVYNESIIDNKKIKTFNIDNFYGLGTPEDLNYYLENVAK